MTDANIAALPRGSAKYGNSSFALTLHSRRSITTTLCTVPSDKLDIRQLLRCINFLCTSVPSSFLSFRFLLFASLRYYYFPCLASQLDGSPPRPSPLVPLLSMRKLIHSIPINRYNLAHARKVHRCGGGLIRSAKRAPSIATLYRLAGLFSTLLPTLTPKIHHL